MKTMGWLKLNRVAGVFIAAILAACSKSPSNTGSSAKVAEAPGAGDNLTAAEIAGKSREAYAALTSYSDSGTVISEMAGQNVALTFSTRLQRPNLYRIEWTQGSGPKGVALPENKGTVWCDGSGDYFQATAPLQEKDAKLQKMQSMKQAFGRAAGLSWSAAATIPGAFFGENLGDVFVAPVMSGSHPLQRETDAKVGDVDCYVVSSVIDLFQEPAKAKPGTVSTTLWIGKSDFLIHQSRTKHTEKVDSSAATSDQAIDDAIKKALAAQNKPVTPEAIAAMRPQMRQIMKQVQSTLKTSFEKGVVTTQTRENVVVNQQLSPADFAQ